MHKMTGNSEQLPQFITQILLSTKGKSAIVVTASFVSSGFSVFVEPGLKYI